jgi:hypothetical protein
MSCLACNLNVHYLPHNSPPLDGALGRIISSQYPHLFSSKPIQTLVFYYSVIENNVILRNSEKWPNLETKTKLLLQNMNFRRRVQ